MLLSGLGWICSSQIWSVYTWLTQRWLKMRTERPHILRGVSSCTGSFIKWRETVISIKPFKCVFFPSDVCCHSCGYLSVCPSAIVRRGVVLKEVDYTQPEAVWQGASPWHVGCGSWQHTVTHKPERCYLSAGGACACVCEDKWHTQLCLFGERDSGVSLLSEEVWFSY